MRHIRKLADAWRREAAKLRQRGLDREARFEESLADELERTLARWWMEELTLREAARENGCSYSQMQKLVASGEVVNAGREGAPLVLRRDLPIYDGRCEELREVDPDAQDALTAMRKAG